MNIDDRKIKFAPDFYSTLNPGRLENMNELLEEPTTNFNLKYDTLATIKAKREGFKIVREYAPGCFIENPIR